MPKDSTYEFQKVFAELNASNRKYALAVLRSLHFAQEEKRHSANTEAPKKDTEKSRGDNHNNQ